MCSTRNPLLDAYWPSERRAIIVHKYYLGLERGYDPSLAEAIESWEERFAARWRERKLRHDAEVQLREIEAYRERLCQEHSRDVDFNEAARNWIEHYEATWRERWEESTCAGA